MSESIANSGAEQSGTMMASITGNRMSVAEIAERLSVGRQTVYMMLEQGILPGIRLGQRWLITRYAYEEWERNCGKCNHAVPPSGFRADREVRS